MTDNEIIKALECCANNPNECVCYESKCPLFGQKSIDILSKNALDLIKRQKAEIERLEERILEVQRCDQELIETLHKIHEKKEKTTKAEAVKEFAEELKEHKIDVDVSYGYGREQYTEAVAVIDIDNLVKEMVGEGGGRKLKCTVTVVVKEL